MFSYEFRPPWPGVFTSGGTVEIASASPSGALRASSSSGALSIANTWACVATTFAVPAACRTLVAEVAPLQVRVEDLNAWAFIWGYAAAGVTLEAVLWGWVESRGTWELQRQSVPVFERHAPDFGGLGHLRHGAISTRLDVSLTRSAPEFAGQYGLAVYLHAWSSAGGVAGSWARNADAVVGSVTVHGR